MNKRLNDIKQRYISDPDLMHKLTKNDVDWLIYVAECAKYFASVEDSYIPYPLRKDFERLREALEGGENE